MFLNKASQTLYGICQLFDICFGKGEFYQFLRVYVSTFSDQNYRLFLIEQKDRFTDREMNGVKDLLDNSNNLRLLGYCAYLYIVDV